MRADARRHPGFPPRHRAPVALVVAAPHQRVNQQHLLVHLHVHVRGSIRLVRIAILCGVSGFGKEAVMQRRESKTYSDEEIKQRLQKELPKWYFEDGWIRRKYKTEGWKGTLMVVITVGHLAEATWHHPDLTVSYAFVIVKLLSHDAKGITDRDFELAKKIEEVVHWQPGKAGGALTGTPNDDQLFRYIKYDYE